MTIKAGQELKSLGQERAAAVLRHPAQQATASNIAELISWLRLCEQPSDFYEFQRHLFGYLYKVEERRGQCSRIVKRLQHGKSLPADAPPVPPSGDPTQLESWEFEAYVYERLARQLRAVDRVVFWIAMHPGQRASMVLGSFGRLFVWLCLVVCFCRHGRHVNSVNLSHLLYGELCNLVGYVITSLRSF